MTKTFLRKSLSIQCFLAAAIFSVYITSVYAQAKTQDSAQGFEAGVDAYLAGHYLKAYQIWKPLADEGGPVAMFNIGVLYAQGLGLTQNDKVAFEWYRKSAEGGYAPAQFNFGTAYANGKGVARNDPLAAKWWQAAAKQDHVQAQYNLATLYYLGRGVDKDIEKAKSWYQAAADRGDDRARKALQTIAKEKPSKGAKAATSAAPTSSKNNPPVQKKSPGKASAPAKPAAQKSKFPPQAKAKTGANKKKESDLRPNEDWIRKQNPNYYTVQLVADADENNVKKYILRHQIQDRAVYFKSTNPKRPWYKVVYGAYATPSEAKAAVKRLPKGVQRYTPWVRSFRTVYRELAPKKTAPETSTPKPVSKTKPKSANQTRTEIKPSPKISRQSRQAPQRIAKFTASEKSLMLQKGQHAFNGQKYAEALKYWQPLAEAGVAEAQYGLGFMYESGWGVKKDYTTANIWYTQAANQGHAKSQYNLGMLYILGQGVEQNDNLGIYWVQNAADNNDKRAKEFIERSRHEKPVKSRTR